MFKTTTIKTTVTSFFNLNQIPYGQRQIILQSPQMIDDSDSITFKIKVIPYSHDGEIILLLKNGYKIIAAAFSINGKDISFDVDIADDLKRYEE